MHQVGPRDKGMSLLSGRHRIMEATERDPRDDGFKEGCRNLDHIRSRQLSRGRTVKLAMI